MQVAVVQMDPQIGESERNLAACVARMEEAAAGGATLVVMPECAIPGYMFGSAEEALPHAEEIPGPSTEALERECRRLGVHVVCGLLERDGDALRNAAVLVGPDGLVGTYRKTHLPFLGVDRFAVPGDELPVFETPLGRIGMEICYDLRFPEVTRTLALAGADIVAHPTNFPLAAKVQTEVITRARAAENRIYLLTANRVGRERRGEFCGWSQIVDPYGARLAEAGESGEALLLAEIDVARARQGLRRPGRVRALPLRSPPARALRCARRAAPRSRGLTTTPEGAAMARDKELVPDAVLNRGGVKVSKSPWGPRDEIGRLNWITRDTNRAILEHLDGRHLFDLNVEYFIGMPSWVAAGDPPYGIWMTHTPDGSVNDNLSGVGSAVHKKYSYCGDSIHLYTHCGTHIDTLNHLGHYGTFWNGWKADRLLGSRIWNKGGPEKYPPVIARAVMLDVAGMKGVDVLPDAYAITPRDLQQTVRRQKVELRRKDVVLVRTGRMRVWPDFSGYLERTPGIGLAAARWLCEEVGAMCIGADTIALEVLPSEEQNVFLPVHAYMFSTAGAQIIEVVDMEELAAEQQYEFAFLGFPMKLRGATGAPMPSYAVPLRD